MRETIDFGIDLGTTNSAIAVNNNGEVHVVKNNDGWDYTPSAVWMPKPGVVHVGRRARERAVSDPDNAYAEFKLDMGIAGAERHFAKAGVSLTPEMLSAEVLKSLRQDAAHEDGDPPGAAVITVPAAFALNQNAATGRAAELAGLGASCPLVQEPTAAAIAYGFQDAADSAYWMVFDFGGGTFDAAVVSKRDGELLVLNHAGDPYLGGKLIDWAIVERLLAPAVVRELGLADFRREVAGWRVNFAKLKGAAEEAKILLSRNESADIMVDLQDGHGGTESFEYKLTRGALDDLSAPYYDRAVKCCRDALAEGGLQPADIDRLLLVGGTTLAPTLRERLADPRHGLGIRIDHSQDPTTVVARGAAIFAGTVRLAAPPPPTRVGEFTVELNYDPRVTETIAPVSGTVRSATEVDWTRYSVVLSNPDGRPPFSTPRIALSPEGTFFTDVTLDPHTTSRFTVELTDDTGARQRLSPQTLTMTHADVTSGGTVLTHSLGIGKADGTFAPLLRKGTTLPAEGRNTYRTTIALRQSDPKAVIRIPLVEGERPRAERNTTVGMLEIRRGDVRFDLPAHSDVEMTLHVDESRILTAVADVPLVDAQFEVEINLSEVRPPEQPVLEEQLREVEARLERLREEAADAGLDDVRDRLERMDDSQVDEVRGQVRAAGVDVGAASMGDRRLRDLQAELDEAEEAIEFPRLAAELRGVLDACEELVERSRDPEHRRQLTTLRNRLDRVVRERDRSAAQALMGRLQGFLADLLRAGDHWEVTMFYALRDARSEMTSLSRADALFEEGEQALAAGDRQALAAVNERLRRLLPREAASSLPGGLQ
ncbi:MAG TPA: Hsp70 family protein [Streptomyces sp.]|uniref:Hsp70 family protein n=1 Tax=Streptomyces sp. TaxID=1931 RepID=UPI002D3D5AC7|nr:Hsp70 family protein [Streptomyces sp.]HZG03219.1 Hsp70 family protein [Streptomyces sp.]